MGRTSSITALPSPQLEEVKFGSISIFTDEALFKARGIRIAFTTREGGVSAGPYDSLNLGGHVDDDPERFSKNREIVLEALAPGRGLTVVDSLIVPKQVHGDEVLSIESATEVACMRQAAEEGADAIIVGTTDLAALLCFADCVPLIIVMPTGRFAVIHAGWRGVENTIAVKALSIMLAQEQCETESARAEMLAGTNVYIGAHIHRECFETNPEVHALFTSKFGKECAFDDRHIDLNVALRIQLERSGVQVQRIADIDACTVCENDRFFSFRAQDGIAGRHGAIAIRLA